MDILRHFLCGFFATILLLCISGYGGHNAISQDNGIPGGPSHADIKFTYVPSYGSFENLKGQVWHVKPADHMVAVYIYVLGGCWTKPYWSHPLTPIQDDGSWECNITTGGIDEQATEIVAYLVPKEYDPPLMSGESSELPTELDENSLAKVQTSRESKARLTARHILFSGYNWTVKSSKIPVGPGPNYFSESNESVWLDEQGQLHLKITKRNGRWYCAEVISEKSFGYGRYLFYLASKVDQLNENVVVGLFTWSDDPEYNHREIDIEFSRWGQPANDNAQFVVQPWDRLGNVYRFNIQLNGDYSTHSFNWRSESISFQSLHGYYFIPPNSSYIIESWNYTGEGIPRSGNENARINLWLFNGNPPSDSMEPEIVIKKFEFIP